MWEAVQAWFSSLSRGLSKFLGDAASVADSPVQLGIILFVASWLVFASVVASRIVFRRKREAAARPAPPDAAGTPQEDAASPSAPKPAKEEPAPDTAPRIAGRATGEGGVHFRDFSSITPPNPSIIDFPDKDVLIRKRQLSTGQQRPEAQPTGLPGEGSVTTAHAGSQEMPSDAAPTEENHSADTAVEPPHSKEGLAPVAPALPGAQEGLETDRDQSPGAQSGVPPVIGRPDDPTAHDRNYNRFRSSFELFLREHVHLDVRAVRTVHVGLAGRPVLCTYPTVFWKQPESFFDEDLHQRADALLVDLHYHAVRCTGFHPATSLRDREVAVALFHHALWRGRVDLLCSLVFRMEEAGDLFPELRELSVVILKLVGLPGPAQAIDRDDSPMTPYLAACSLFLDALIPGEAALSRIVRRAGSLRETRLIAWLRGAATADRALETSAVRGLMAESVGTGERVELFAALLNRGLLFRATRMLYRLQRSRHAYGRPILELYFRNGKYHGYLRALQAVGPVRGPRTYYETAFCLALSRLEVKRDAAIAEFQRQGLIPELPSMPERMRFERTLEAVDRSQFRPAGIPQRFSELVGLLYFYAQQAQTLQSPERQKGYVRALVRAFRNNLNAPEDLFRHELVLPYLIWGFLYNGNEILDPVLIPFLESLSGRSQAVRVLLGVDREQRGDYETAFDYLACSPQHPFVLHRMAQLKHRSGDVDAAVRIASRLVRLYPGEAVFRHNQGVLLEVSGRRYEAEQAYGRAVDLQSDLRVSQDRLSRLLALRTAGR